MQICEKTNCCNETRNGYDVCPDCYGFMSDFFEEEEDWLLEGVSYASELQGLPDCVTECSDTQRYAVFESNSRLKLVPVEEVEP